MENSVLKSAFTVKYSIFLIKSHTNFNLWIRKMIRWWKYETLIKVKNRRMQQSMQKSAYNLGDKQHIEELFSL